MEGGMCESEGRAGAVDRGAGTRWYPPYREGRGRIVSADRARACGRESILAEWGSGPAWVLG